MLHTSLARVVDNLRTAFGAATRPTKIGLVAPLFAFGVLAVGCAGQKDTSNDPPATEPSRTSATPSSPPPTKPATMPVAVTWTLERDPSGGALVAKYRVENHGDQPIFVLDEIVSSSAKGYMTLPDRAIVRYEPSSSTLVLVAGQLAPSDAVAKGAGVGVQNQTIPVARPLAAGASLTGEKRIALPLTAWHPDIRGPGMEPIPAEPAQAVLEVSWLPEDPPPNQPAWQERPAAAGGTLRTPTEVFVQLKKQTARGAVLKLPQ